MRPSAPRPIAEPIPSLPVAKPEDVALSPAGLARLTGKLRSDIDNGRVPGVVAMIVRHGGMAYFESLGVRDPSSGAPMQKDTIFRIYSMTKPMVSVAAMMLVEEGRLLINDPVAKFLPEFADPKVAVERDGRVELVPAVRNFTVQDLLRHTSGLGYEIRGTGAVQRRYMEAKIFRRDQTNAEHAATLAKLPLMHQPGTRWEYGRSTDVLGRVVEVIAGKSLGEVLAERIIEPLGMVDTAFFVPPSEHHRLAEPFAKDPDTGAQVQLLDVRSPPMFESGGGGLVSTAGDYVRFCQMLLNGGTFDRVRFLSRKTIEYMTADHLGPVTGSSDLLAPGYGFGLGFTVRIAAGIAPFPGSVGQYSWGGISGTSFWIDPQEALIAILMIQAPGQRDYFRPLFRNLVYASFAD